ncbi:Polymorphic mucin variant IC-r2/1-3.2 [Schistosoma japonicum]|nr:Polymorphic mucin variant IC-r2/1-3.2 [Schistosoma japonicum]
MNLNMQLDEFKMAVYNSLIQKYVSLHYYPEHCEANKIHDKSWQVLVIIHCRIINGCSLFHFKVRITSKTFQGFSDTQFSGMFGIITFLTLPKCTFIINKTSEYWRWVYIYYAEWANEYLSGQGPDVKELLDNYTDSYNEALEANKTTYSVYGHLEKSIAKFWEEKKSLNSLGAEYFAQSGTIQCGNEQELEMNFTNALNKTEDQLSKVMTVELKTIETFKKYQQNKETMVTLIGEYEYRKIQFLKVLSEDKRRQYILDELKKVAAEGKMQS